MEKSYCELTESKLSVKINKTPSLIVLSLSRLHLFFHKLTKKICVTNKLKVLEGYLSLLFQILVFLELTTSKCRFVFTDYCTIYPQFQNIYIQFQWFLEVLVHSSSTQDPNQTASFWDLGLPSLLFLAPHLQGIQHKL